MMPSRLIGRRLTVRVHADRIECEYRGAQVALIERQGADRDHIDYRHIIHSLVRKPGAFRRYVFREALYPTLTYRRAYEALVHANEGRADLEYVRILHLAASDGERAVESVLSALLSRKEPPYYESVRLQVRGPRTGAGVPDVLIGTPDLTSYDRLLVAHSAGEL
jgi:hypothetical protein